MPIYAYRCDACQFAQDVLQKMSDAPPACPQCDAGSMRKQLTAAGFQLKGTGWYASDFKNPPSAASANTASTTTAATAATTAGNNSSSAESAAPTSSANAATPVATPTASSAGAA